MSEERDRKWAYEWVAEAIRQRLHGTAAIGLERAKVLEIYRIHDALEAAADVPLSPCIDLSASVRGLAGAPPPAGGSKAVPPAAGAVESSLVVVSASPSLAREQEAAVEASPGPPPPASSSRELSCDDVVRWLDMDQPGNDQAFVRRCDDHLMECASCRSVADVRELAVAARLG